MTKHTLTVPFLLSLFAQLIAGGVAVWVWPGFLNLIRAGTGEFLVGSCNLFNRIHALAIFLLVSKKAGFLLLMEMDRISVRNLLLLMLSFLVAILIGLPAKDVLPSRSRVSFFRTL